MSGFAAFFPRVAQHGAKREGKMSGMWLPISPLLMISLLGARGNSFVLAA